MARVEHIKFLSVSADDLLGKTNVREPFDQLIVSDMLKDAAAGFHRDEFKGLTQDEADALAVIGKKLKSQRKF